MLKYCFIFSILFISSVVCATRNMMHDAAQRGDIDAVFKILQSNPMYIYDRDEQGALPVHYSAANGHDDITSMMLEIMVNTYHIDFDYMLDMYMNSPVDYAIANGHLKVVRAIIKKFGRMQGLIDFIVTRMIVLDATEMFDELRDELFSRRRRFESHNPSLSNLGFPLGRTTTFLDLAMIMDSYGFAVRLRDVGFRTTQDSIALAQSLGRVQFLRGIDGQEEGRNSTLESLPDNPAVIEEMTNLILIGHFLAAARRAKYSEDMRRVIHAVLDQLELSLSYLKQLVDRYHDQPRAPFIDLPIGRAQRSLIRAINTTTQPGQPYQGLGLQLALIRYVTVSRAMQLIFIPFIPTIEVVPEVQTQHLIHNQSSQGASRFIGPALGFGVQSN